MAPEIPCSELLMRLGDDEVLVLDCREDGEWALSELQIPGALRMNLHELQHGVTALPDDELIVICGDKPDGADARRAWRMITAANRRAVCLHGGLHAWIAAGFPTERRIGFRPQLPG
ncbi:MAG: rhodanese-like domain-containing protein [Myxococcaceae bacterium]